ncbi:MAG: hypothetical protein V1856_00355 [Candidatus Liptonbacteria bacterium]
MRLESVSDHSLETQERVVSIVEKLYRWYAPSHNLERITDPKVILTNNPSGYARKVLEHMGLV